MKQLQSEPMTHVDDWEESLKARYPAPGGERPKESFRDYRAEARPSVKEFYRLNHRHQTLDFVKQKKAEYLPLRKKKTCAHVSSSPLANATTS